MDNQIYNGFSNHKQLATYQKITAMSKLVDNTINTYFNKDGFVVFFILLHENQPQYVNNFEKGGF
jgi:hypothetical protein